MGAMGQVVKTQNPNHQPAAPPPLPLNKNDVENW